MLTRHNAILEIDGHGSNTDRVAVHGRGLDRDQRLSSGSPAANLRESPTRVTRRAPTLSERDELWFPGLSPVARTNSSLDQNLTKAAGRRREQPCSSPVEAPRDSGPASGEFDVPTFGKTGNPPWKYQSRLCQRRLTSIAGSGGARDRGTRRARF